MQNDSVDNFTEQPIKCTRHTNLFLFVRSSCVNSALNPSYSPTVAFTLSSPPFNMSSTAFSVTMPCATASKKAQNTSSQRRPASKSSEKRRKRLICASQSAGMGAAEELSVYLAKARATGSGLRSAGNRAMRPNSRAPVHAPVVGPTVIMHPGLERFGR